MGLLPDQCCGDESDYFLSVLFPDDQLKIMAYNRVVKDLNGLGADEFLRRVEQKFSILSLPAALQEIFLKQKELSVCISMKNGIC